MNPARNDLLAAFTLAVQAERVAVAAAHAAKVELRAAMKDQAGVVAALMAAGLTSAQVAHHAAQAAGGALDVGSRVRLAARLRKRVSRLVTIGHGRLPRPPGVAAATPIRLDDKEGHMAIVHRKTVEEWIEDPELDSLEDPGEDEDGDVEDAEKRRPQRR